MLKSWKWLVFAVVLGAVPLVRAAPGELHVLLGVDPSDETRTVALSPTLAPSISLSKYTGEKVTITQTANMSDVMRASRAVDNEVIIGPAHVTASAVLHAYTLVATGGEERSFALIAVKGIAKLSQLPGKRLYLPQQDSLRSYVAKGLLQESGIKLAQFGKVTYGNTSAGGLVALAFGLADATVADEAEARDWLAKNPGRATVLKMTRPVPAGMNIVVRKDVCATECAKIAAWVNSPDGEIDGIGHFKVAGPDARQQFVYIASLGITTPDSLPGAVTVSADKVAELALARVVVVDTRSGKEFDAEHIRGAINLPYVERSLKETDFDATKDDFSALGKLTKDQPVVFLCNGPECWKSYKASRAAVAAGFGKVYWFRGGMPEWRDKQMPVDGAVVVGSAAGPAAPRH
jgi:rhodanese-related sulfurtransferase